MYSKQQSRDPPQTCLEGLGQQTGRPEGGSIRATAASAWQDAAAAAVRGSLADGRR